jgi:hypothetical protein
MLKESERSALCGKDLAFQGHAAKGTGDEMAYLGGSCGWHGENMPKPKHVQRGSRISPTIRVLEPNAAGIEIGATEVFVAIPSDRDPRPVRRFSTFTDHLNCLVDWLQTCGVDSVAMESSSVFWIPLF